MQVIRQLRDTPALRHQLFERPIKQRTAVGFIRTALAIGSDPMGK